MSATVSMSESERLFSHVPSSPSNTSRLCVSTAVGDNCTTILTATELPRSSVSVSAIVASTSAFAPSPTPSSDSSFEKSVT